MNIHDIHTGDIGLVQNTTVLARIIQFFQKLRNKKGYQYNHSFIFWWCYGKLFVIEACERGVCITNFEEEYMKKQQYKSVVGLRPNIYVDGSKLGEFMIPYIGHTGYNWFALAVQEPIKILFDKWLGTDKQSKKYFLCYQWIGYVYENTYKGLITDGVTGMPSNLLRNNNFTNYVIK